MKFMQLFLILLPYLLIGTGCGVFESPSYTEGTFFYLHSKGVDMPVWVNGNTNSGVAILHLHGGPGSCSLGFHYVEPFQKLEKDYAVIYWDQRGSGNAQGNYDKNDLTVAQYTQDLDDVITAINSMFKFSKIVLMGHSWGGTLGTAYLLNPVRQAKIAGWIEVNGGHNLVDGNILSRQWVIDYATKTTNSSNPDDQKKWTTILNWYDTNQILTLANINTHAGYIDEANGYFMDPKFKGNAFWIDLALKILPNNPQNPFSILLNNPVLNPQFDIYNINYSPQMSTITIPSLVLWGLLDGRFPVALAYDAYNALGTPTNKKFIAILSNSAHNPMIEDPDLFYNAVSSFMHKI